MNRIFLAATGNSLARADNINGEWHVANLLDGVKVNRFGLDPFHERHIYAGTQRNGVLLSTDAGKTWQPRGMEDISVKSLALSAHHPGVIYAGCKPASLYVSRDSGATWNELEGLRRARRWWWLSPAEPPGLTPYVMALTVSPTHPDLLFAGIELGGVLCSTDGGETWSGHQRGAVLDCHSLKFHSTNGEWIYEGGGGGAAVSKDGGLTWSKPKAGLTKKYGWAVAADPVQPEIWYLSASAMANLLRGEFVPPAHTDGKARAGIFRSTGSSSWEQLSGGLPDPMNYMAYALITDPYAPGYLYAGLSNGDVWHTSNHGDNWSQMPLNLGRIHYAMVMITAEQEER